ncbi:hypothetical protein JXA56_01110, partial [Candidatus Micrarchaeota archaeon]|nr:hypothetical protein [Candidatus Micrarchaeota archaeon]
HIWNSYECGEPDCPPCTTGRCEDHQCVERDLLCPENAEIGSEVTCLATQNNASCDGCTIEVTHPDGTKTSGKTDDGRFAFPIDNAGIYIVSLVVNGEALISEEVSVALPIIPMLPDGLPLLEIVAILAIIGLLLLLLLLWKRKKGIVAELITKTPALGKPVQVKVEDKSHKGIGKIGVSVFHNGKLSESGMSAKKGEFSFTPKKKGSYAVHIMGRKKPETTFEL